MNLKEKQKVPGDQNLKKVQGGVSLLAFLYGIFVWTKLKLFLSVFSSWKHFGMSLPTFIKN